MQQTTKICTKMHKNFDDKNYSDDVDAKEKTKKKRN